MDTYGFSMLIPMYGDFIMMKISIATEHTSDSDKIAKCLNPNNMNIATYTSLKSLVYDLDEYELNADIVFIEIVIDNCNGVKIAKKIKEKFPFTQIIFIALKECNKLDVYDVEHAYTIRSVITEDKVKKSMEHACRRLLQQDQSKFYYSIGRKKYFVAQKDILYFEKDKRKIRMHLLDDTYIEFYGTFENTLLGLSIVFIRCHNSYMVNRMYVNKLEGMNITMDDGKNIPISRAYADCLSVICNK